MSFVSGTTRIGRTRGRSGSSGVPSKSMRSRTSATPTMSSRFSPNTAMRLYFVSRITRRSSPTVLSAAMATMSGRGVITSRTRVSANRARESTARASSVSWTGGGGTAGTSGGTAESSLRPPGAACRRRALTSGPTARAYSSKAGSSRRSERSGLRRTSM